MTSFNHPVLWIIAVLSVAAWSVVFRTTLDVIAISGRRLGWVAAILTLMRGGKADEATALCQVRHDAVGRILSAAIEMPPVAPGPGRSAVLRHIIEAETLRFRRRLAVIAALATSAPLLGLLGTVLGMITAFAVLPGGPGSSVQEMSGGISGALLTTQAGMVAALPLLLCHCWLQGQVRDTMHNATLCAGELEKIIARNK